MRLSSWLRSARALLVQSGTKKTPRTSRAGIRLNVEQLDDRIVPSTFTVNNLADSGAVDRANRYGTPGRPEVEYRRRD